MPDVQNKVSRAEPGVYTVEVKRSFFDGEVFQLLLWRLLALLLTVLTLGLGFPWAMCMVSGREAAHTVINGRRLCFTGRGGELFWRYLLWLLLTVLTLGIYTPWLAVNVIRWKTGHTVYADEPDSLESRFTGGAGGWLWQRVTALLVTVFTLGIGGAWAHCKLVRWEAMHTYIGGSPLVFTGTGPQLLGKYAKLILFTVLTLGIYLFVFPVSYLKWKVSHLLSLSCTPAYTGRSRAHEQTVAEDAVRYRQANNDTQLERVKSGITGEETDDALRSMAEAGNRSAMHELAWRLKGDAEDFTGDALAFLRGSAMAGYHPAMLDYALTLQNDAGALYAQLLEGSARNGNPRAPWLLKTHYEIAAWKLHGKGGYDSAEQLQKAAYWFCLAMALGDGDALREKGQYDKMVETIALWMMVRGEKKEKAGAKPGLLIAAALLAAAIICAVIFWPETAGPVETEPPQAVQLWCDGKILKDTDELYQHVPWEPGVVTYENLEVRNTGDDRVRFNLSLDPGEGGDVLCAVALERRISREDLESVMKNGTPFIPVETLTVSRSLEPGETYRVAVLLYWPGGETAQVPDGMTLPAEMQIRAVFELFP